VGLEASAVLRRTKSSLAFKARRRPPVPITPCRTTSLLRGDITQPPPSYLAGKAYTLPRRQRQQPSSLQSFAAAGAATPPLARLATTATTSGGLTVWLGGEEDLNVVDRLSPTSSAARCTCTMRRVVATTTTATRSSPPSAAPAASARGLTASVVDASSSFTTFKPSSAAAGDVPPSRSSVSDCGMFYDRPPPSGTGQRDDVGGGGTDYFPQCRGADRFAN